MFFFWDRFFKLKSVKYSTRNRRRVRIGTFVFKFKRTSSKKVVKKTKTNSLFRVLKMNLSSGIFSNIPPLSTHLNLLGINTQKFCDDINIGLKEIFFPNILIILHVFIFKNLTYNYKVFINTNFLLKNLTFLVDSGEINSSNLMNLHVSKLKLSLPQFDEIFLKRVFFNYDVLLFIYFFLRLSRFLFDFNFLKIDSFFFFNRGFFYFENFFRVLHGTLRSFNLRTLCFKNLDRKSF